VWGVKVVLALSAAPGPVQELCVSGLGYTRESTVRALLPRQPPSQYSARELKEFERRLTNLGVFDAIELRVQDQCLLLNLREKWTLIPTVAFVSGSTWKDTAALLGIVEYNFLGRANTLGMNVFREQRGWGFSANFAEHPYKAGRWAIGVELAAATTEQVFLDGSGWSTTGFSAGALLTSPPWQSDHLSYSLGGFYARELVRSAASSSAPPSNHAGGTRLAFTWDAYTWDDLVPAGLFATLRAEVGMFAAGAVPQPRHNLLLESVGSLRLSNRTALVARVMAGAFTRGNANYSQIIGSIVGVRGLIDGYYHTWSHAFTNVELRHSVRLAPRWAIQGVLFSDAAVFEQITPAGRRGDSSAALSLGVGMRLVPTWLANVVVRVDAARLIEPEPRWFLQAGLNQYF